HRAAERGWVRRHLDAGCFECRDLGGRVAFTAGNDRAGVAHTATWRRGGAGDETDSRLPAALFAFVGKELRGVFFGRAADFADHDDRLGFRIAEEKFEHIDELGALHRIAADADGGRLAEAFVGGLEHGFVSQRAGARDDADAAFLEDLARHDADLALIRREDAGAVRA